MGEKILIGDYLFIGAFGCCGGGWDEMKGGICVFDSVGVLGCSVEEVCFDGVPESISPS